MSFLSHLSRSSVWLPMKLTIWGTSGRPAAAHNDVVRSTSALFAEQMKPPPNVTHRPLQRQTAPTGLSSRCLRRR